MKPTLIVMLTLNDLTVGNATEVFEQSAHANAEYWGFKEKPLEEEQMKELCKLMKSKGKTVFMEVVSYTEEEGLNGAKMASKCGCDILLGTMYFDSINQFCKENGMKYMPFVGKITGRPSVLEGSIEDIVNEAKMCISKGVYGIDLLGYRYTGDKKLLIKTLIESIDAPVCLAGSIDSYGRLDEVKEAGPWTFTIGSAFFNHKFGDDISTQIDNVCDYMNKNEVVEYYDTIADNYDESRFNNSYGQFIDAEERKILDQLIDVSKGTTRLDMACGTGRLTNYATHGLDASKEMMEYARKRFSNIEFRQASATDSGFADEMFDTVYSFHFLMHIDTPTITKVFDEVYRILKPGGKFIFDIPSAERRKLLNHKQQSWHGATHLTHSEINEMAGDKFQLSKRYGIMMFPVHKLPVSIRKRMLKLDYALANSCLKKYSSYLVYELVKK